MSAPFIASSMETDPTLTSESLHIAILQEEYNKPSHFDPHEIRLSEAGQCPRRQTLRALDYVPTPHTLRDLAIFETGHLEEERITAMWATRFPTEQLIREVEVRTEFGVGHIDLWVDPIHHLVECKTTTEKQIPRLPLQSHVAQVTMYLHFWGNARGATAEISYRIKETGQIKSFPVVYDRQYARQLIAGLMEVQASITILQEPLPIPDDYQATGYPCAWHTKDGLVRCGFWEYCWGQQVTTLTEKKDVVAVVPPLASDVQEYADLRVKQSALEAQIDLLDVRRDALEAGFGQVLDERGAHLLRAGDLTLKRSLIEGRTTTNVHAAIADGVVSDTDLKPYQKTSPGYARWSVRAPKKTKTAAAPTRS